MCIFNVNVPHITHFLHCNLNCYLHTHISLNTDSHSLIPPKIPNDCLHELAAVLILYVLSGRFHKRTLVLSYTEIIVLYLTALFMGVDNCTLQRCLIGAQPAFIGVGLLC